MSGRPSNKQRDFWAEKFGITGPKRNRILSYAVMAQLSLCRSDEARRLLLTANTSKHGNEAPAMKQTDLPGDING